MVEVIPEEAQMLDLLNKNFKSAILYMLKKVKENHV